MFKPTFGPLGSVRQGGLPTNVQDYGSRAHGILLRGVVLRNYVYDEEGVPFAPNPGIAPAAVYSDVLVYSSIPGARFAVFPRCVVSQNRAGLHDGDLWIPRATTMDISGAALNTDTTTNIANMDGDHVLLGFLDNDLSQPVILKALPHPRADIGAALPEAIDEAGHRVRLLVKDGEPALTRHHGTFWGATKTGDFQVDTTRAHDGTLESNGTEPAPPFNGTVGNIRIRLPQGSNARIEVISDPNAPNEAASKLCEVIIEDDQVRVRLANEDNLTLMSGGSAATLQVGDGAQHVAIVEHLRALYLELKARLDAFDAAYVTHTHIYAFGPTLTPLPPTTVSAPAWNGSIESTKVSLPDG